MASKLLSVIALVVLLSPLAVEAEWRSVGPFGGDARALAADPSDPNRLYLGTGTGQVYLTTDAGREWTRLTGLEAPSDWVVDNLAIDSEQPGVVYAAMWSLGRGGGGVFKTPDGGTTWMELEGLRGRSVRALALAPSQPQTLVVGTLEGVFRSDDAGAGWQRISPLGHAEIHSVESVAIDPRNPQIIYAGTWHLAWKTTDGGASWTSIKKGMIDDSDVFSIVIDPARPDRVYATALPASTAATMPAATGERSRASPTVRVGRTRWFSIRAIRMCCMQEPRKGCGARPTEEPHGTG